jgi:glyoxalase family protein
MDALIRGLHHVTATVSGAQDDLDFYSGALGQRLVKRTINFDNPGVYHFYYGNESGTPGTIMTTFPYDGMGVRPGIQGAGQITVTSFSVPAVALDFWRRRLTALGVAYEDVASPFGEEALHLHDASGLVVRLVGSVRDDRPPWTRPDIDADRAIRGIHGVSLLVRDPARTVTFLRDLLDGAVVNEAARATRVGIGEGLPGQVVEVLRAAGGPDAVNGLGTVHHVAFAVGDAEEQLRMRRELVRRGVHVTEVLDRQYFQSIYFREPNVVLFEIATVPPGFTADESLPELGRTLKLPPWEEPRRAAIEAVLPSVAA